jgi:hypothetical protein
VWGWAARKGSLKMPKRKARPVTVSAPQKGRSKSKGGIPVDELLAAHAPGRPVVSTKKTAARASSSGETTENEAKESPRTAFAAPG